MAVATPGRNPGPETTCHAARSPPKTPAGPLLLALTGAPWHPSGQFERTSPVDKTELAKLEGYLRRTFANHAISVRARMKKNDSAEVYLADEFIGIIHVDDEDGDRSFNFTMAILDVDLED
jgi:hypothetical protein